MSRLSALPLLASAALLLAVTGCSLEKLDRVDSVLPAAIAGTVAEPSAGHEVHAMFEAQKRNAAIGELPSQF
jgi:hypothetical protein